MSRPPLTQADLAGATCQSPGCAHTGEQPLFLHARCHLYAPTQANYLNGVLTLRCAECDALVAQFEIAKGPVQ